MNNLKVKPLALAIALGLSPSALVYAQSDSSADAQLEEVIVTGVKAADLNAREAERSKDAFSSIISQDDAGNFADQNVAESLQRLPGITLQKSEGEGRYVNVRGLGADFVSVTMNGAEMASGGGDGRAFALDAIPADMLGAIEVYKSLTPDMDLNSIGGSVNVKTVSAFDKKRDSLKIKAQINNQHYKDELSPKLAISGTNLLFDDKIGIGYSLSTEKRNSVNYEVRHHSTTDARYITVGDTTALVPYQFENRQEEGERTRNAGSLDIGYRPNDDSEYHLRLSHTSYQDLDVALREYYRLDTAQESEFVYLDVENRIAGTAGTELQHQFFIQDGVATTDAFAIGGKNNFDGGWEVEYEFSKSIAEWDKPGASRVQFRLRDMPMIAAWGSNYLLAQPIQPDHLEILAGVDQVLTFADYKFGERQQPSMGFDNLFIEDSFRTDDLSQLKVDIRKEFDSGKVNFIKFGGVVKTRERDRNKDRWSVIPSDKASIGCPVAADPALCDDLASSQLGDFETFVPAHPNFQHDFITYDAARYLIDATRTVATEFDKNNNDQDSVKEDYFLTENAQNIYLMAEFETSANSALIVGGKYESTQMESTGNFSIRWDRTEGSSSATSNDISIPLKTVETTYSDFLPSIHWRFEPREDVLVRAALWTSFTRPNFSDSRASVEFDGRVQLCAVSDLNDCADRATDLAADGAENWDTDEEIKANTVIGAVNTIKVGNPTLKAQRATNLDTSITWYASDDLYLQAALFAKQIDGFIVDVRGIKSTLEDLPFEVPISEVNDSDALNLIPGQIYDDVNMSINGDVANVYGMELTYSQYFNSGLFVQSNATFITSDAKLDESIRTDSIALPYQADETLNFTFGWENDDISLRVISNYRSAVLEQVGTCGVGDECKKWADVYEDNTFGLDFKATWKATDLIDVYFDALNLTGDTSLRYYTGNSASGGKMMYSSEDFGTSFQLGVNIKVM
ncbi:TonB-dependent receptor [Saccharophagus degradans]|uniref:TonB-dependent receptor n=1 Tax=Saccharophagus degradans TaxID=86304 RepID=UPI001C0960FB|nr:TonB-dependent receptor [Saccharophagus degradans]MBU2984482.1 TonB-dependent receptor [Saccharophagus degradans]